MRLWEFCDLSHLEMLGLYTPGDDILGGQRHLSDTRRGTLTLRCLSKLKRARNEKRRTEAERLPLIARQYGPQPEEVDAVAVEKGVLDVANKRLQLAKSDVDLRKKKIDLSGL